MKYHALFVIFEKAAKLEIVVGALRFKYTSMDTVSHEHIKWNEIPCWSAVCGYIESEDIVE